jgi:hypothetical protein
MEEVDRDQDKIKHRAKASANSEHPADSPTPYECKSLPESWLLPKQEDPVSALRIMSHKPAEPCHSSGEEKSERVSSGDGHCMILIQVPQSQLFGNYTFSDFKDHTAGGSRGLQAPGTKRFDGRPLGPGTTLLTIECRIQKP